MTCSPAQSCLLRRVSSLTKYFATLPSSFRCCPGLRSLGPLWHARAPSCSRPPWTSRCTSLTNLRQNTCVWLSENPTAGPSASTTPGGSSSASTHVRCSATMSPVPATLCPPEAPHGSPRPPTCWTLSRSRASLLWTQPHHSCSAHQQPDWP